MYSWRWGWAHSWRALAKFGGVGPSEPNPKASRVRPRPTCHAAPDRCTLTWRAPLRTRGRLGRRPWCMPTLPGGISDEMLDSLISESGVTLQAAATAAAEVTAPARGAGLRCRSELRCSPLIALPLPMRAGRAAAGDPASVVECRAAAVPVVRLLRGLRQPAAL